MADLTHDHDGHSHRAHGHQHGHGNGHGHGGHQHEHDPAREAELAEMLDLDAELLHQPLTGVTEWLAELTTGQTVQSVLDLGTGTGAGTFALLERFPDARVTAVDMSAGMLERVRAKAAAAGLDGRVRTVEADLDADWPDFGTVDLAWSAAALHHVADPQDALRRLRALLRPGGLFALVEIDGLPSFLPEDLGLGEPGLERRCRAVVAARLAEELPYLGADWGPILTGAGFEVEPERRFTVELASPLPDPAARYARLVLARNRERLGDQLGAADLEVLDALIDGPGPENVLRRSDLLVRAERRVWVARRP
ncbi:class I SAM-dependent methyltransferase [Kitasatospora sp. NPDC006697]|uniref:class I SAM-dependent methyltransferase n=1 Tax=Kitasatospora sp. NPDC006697 TaxID=3364020 RepID=UPI0036A02DAD